MGEEMKAVTRIAEGAARTLRHVGFTFRDSSYGEIERAGVYILFLALYRAYTIVDKICPISPNSIILSSQTL